ncbi:phage minor head protein [Pseudomonas sp. O39]|uniref:phage minor head protein n=1 Tax=Pseudomonas sp. O39 TaxID=3379130 RepID=UPI00387B7DA1
MAANQAILDATIRHAVFLEKLKAGEVGKFAPFLKEIDRSIRDRLTQSDLTEYNVKRLEALLKEVDSLLLGIFDRYSAQLNLDLVDIANYEAEFEATSLARSAPVGVSLDVVAPTAASIRTAVLTNPLSVRGTGGGKLLKAFIKGWTGAERERVTGTIRQGFFEGQTNFQIIRNIRGTKAAGYKDGVLATTNRNASTVVHTAIQHVSSQARMEVAKANTDIVQEIQMVATLDSKTSQLCRSMDKRKFPVDSGPRPPFHPNCLPGHTLVTASSGIAGVSKRWFDGEVVVFKTSSGRVLTCTPNHPILTDKGWVAAKELDLRSNVICDGSSKWAGVVDGDDHDMPSSIHEVTEAFLSNSSVLACPVPVSAPYFHGDGVGSEVVNQRPIVSR